MIEAVKTPSSCPIYLDASNNAPTVAKNPVRNTRCHLKTPPLTIRFQSSRKPSTYDLILLDRLNQDLRLFPSVAGGLGKAPLFIFINTFPPELL